MYLVPGVGRQALCITGWCSHREARYSIIGQYTTERRKRKNPLVIAVMPLKLFDNSAAQYILRLISIMRTQQRY